MLVDRASESLHRGYGAQFAFSIFGFRTFVEMKILTVPYLQQSTRSESLLFLALKCTSRPVNTLVSSFVFQMNPLLVEGGLSSLCRVRNSTLAEMCKAQSTVQQRVRHVFKTCELFVSGLYFLVSF